jgi:hypothetical protein
MESCTDFEVLRSGQNEYLTIFVKDPRNDQLVDVIANSTFTLIDLKDDSVILTDTFTASGDAIVNHGSTGVYQYELDTGTYKDEYLAAFRCVVDADVLQNNIYVKSVSAKHFKYAAYLRNQIDKSRKSIVDYIESMERESEAPLKFFYGYDDKHLIFYLERGVQLINMVPPYTGLTVDTFPFQQFGSLLIDAATIAALESAGIFAIDTDVDYSLGGNSFVISHFEKLNSMLSNVTERFQANVTKLKNIYLTKGLVLYQFSPGGVRDLRYISALPSGFWSRLLSGDMQSV